LELRKNEVTSVLTKLRLSNYVIRYFYSSTHYWSEKIKEDEILGSAAYMRRFKTCRKFSETSRGVKLLWGSKHRLEDNIEMNLKEANQGVWTARH
jgi:hypothetical protein